MIREQPAGEDAFLVGLLLSGVAGSLGCEMRLPGCGGGSYRVRSSSIPNKVS